MSRVYTSPKFEFHECKLTFSYDVKAAKWMHQESGILFVSKNIIYKMRHFIFDIW